MRCKKIMCDICGQVIGGNFIQVKIRRYEDRFDTRWEGWSREKKEICPACLQSLCRLVKAETKRAEEREIGKSVL